MRRCFTVLLASFTASVGACLPGYSSTSTAGLETETGASTTDAAPTTGEPTDSSGMASTAAPSCGDGQLDVGELCDGAALGGKSCADVDPMLRGGTLACADDCASFDTSACTGQPGAPKIVLNEVTAKAVTEGPYADMGAAIELINLGAAAADLSGWQLADDATFPPEQTYVFPPASTLAPGAYLVVVAQSGLPFALEGETETLTLADGRGATQDAVTFAVADAATSYCRLPDGADAWQTCAQTFGAKNAAAAPETCGDGTLQPGEQCDGAELGGQTCEGLGRGGGALACAPTCTFDTSQCGGQQLAVVINELESTDDRIELYNAGDQPIDLTGWILTDDTIDPNYDPMADAEKLVFPAMTTLGAKQFLVVPKGTNPGEHPFGLGAGGETVSLLKSDVSVVDQVTYAADEAAVSYCRVPDGPGGAWTVGCQPTFGATNQGP